MAEEKNSFINCKMNKDIDDRLLPNGQYRDARNLQVSRSEGSNVGALQNVLGNALEVDFNLLEGITGLKSIGAFVDNDNNNIYIFLTNYTNPLGNQVYNPDASHFIYLYNTVTNASTKLVEGDWLNFSTTNPIYGVNLLENLLFWTDNRNQPRKINVITAAQNPGYYFQELQVSVAKLNPYQPIELYKNAGLEAPFENDYETTMYDVTSEFLPSYNTGTAIVDATVTSTDVVLNGFDPTSFTPSPHQFVTGIGVTQGTRVVSYDPDTFTLVTDISQTWTNDTVLSFNANPYYDPNYAGDQVFLEDKFVRFSYRFRFDDGEYSLMAPFTQIAFIPKQDGYFEYLGQLLFSETVSPEDRFGHDDETDTYSSTIVSFMKNKVNKILLQVPLPGAAMDLFNNFKIVEVDILYKESDSIAVQVVDTIPVATIALLGHDVIYEYNYESKKPYKTLSSKEITRVYDKVPIRALAQEVISNRIVYGNYQDKFSYPKYLDYNVGWNEKGPFSLEDNTTSIVEYPNHSLKQNRTYQVGIVLADRFGRQSGVILSNSTINTSGFGASTVSVPYSVNDGIYNPTTFPGLALKVLFNEPILLTSETQTANWPGLYNDNTKDPLYNPLGWYSYKIVVKQTQQDYYNVYLPGVIAGNPISPTLGLNTTSYTTLINDNINKVPRDLKEVGPTQVQFRSSVVLYPRVNNICVDQLNNLPPWAPQNQRSPIGNEQYYPGNTKAFVNTISTLNSLFDPVLPISISSPYNQFYDAQSNPLIARLSTTEKLGALSTCHLTAGTAPDYASGQGDQYLAVYETKPVESRLDIYWESASVGLIEDINNSILSGNCGAGKLGGWGIGAYVHNENMDIGTNVVGPIYPKDSLNNPITTSDMTMSVVSDAIVGGSADRTADFELVKYPAGTPLPDSSTLPYDCYFIKTATYFYYGVGASVYESYRFTLTVTSICETSGLPVSSIFHPQGKLTNVVPTITNFTCEDTIFLGPGQAQVYTFQGVNGANPLDLDAFGQPQEDNDLKWTVISQEDSHGNPTNIFSFGLQEFEGPYIPNVLMCSDENANGDYLITIQLCDVQGGGGKLCVECDLTVNYPGATLYYGYNNCESEPGMFGENGPTFTSYGACKIDTFQCRNYIITKPSSFGNPTTIYYLKCNTTNPGEASVNPWPTSRILTNNGTGNTSFCQQAYRIIGSTGGPLLPTELSPTPCP